MLIVSIFVFTMILTKHESEMQEKGTYIICPGPLNYKGAVKLCQ